MNSLQTAGPSRRHKRNQVLNKQGPKMRTTIAVKGPRKGKNQVNLEGFLNCWKDEYPCQQAILLDIFLHLG